MVLWALVFSCVTLNFSFMRLSKESIAGAFAVVIIAVFVVGWNGYFSKKELVFEGGINWLLPPSIRKDKDLQSFSSPEEMKDYIVKGSIQNNVLFVKNGTSPRGSATSTDKANTAVEANVVGKTPFDFSQTNVQVLGVDEPDIVKTNGESLFVSQEPALGVMYDSVQPLMGAGSEKRILPNPLPLGNIHIVEAQSSENLSEVGKIVGRSGNILLSGGALMVLDPKGVFGYDIKDPGNPIKNWNIDVRDGEVIDARLLKDRLYLVQRSYIKRETPCPFVPVAQGTKEVEIACSDIYHPYYPIPAETIYTVMRINPETGLIEKKKSIVGSYDVAMTLFSGGLYTWYPEYKNALDVMYDFFRTNNSLISQVFFLRLEKLREYDISDQSKTQELFYEIEKYQVTLDADSRLKFQNDLENAMSGYLDVHKRELTQTHIFKLDLITLEVEESGSVPGIIHNQFSVDEYQGTLRVATTIGTYSGYFGNAPDEENDMYSLDGNLDVQGSVEGIGKGERIYATRFVGDRGYIVTFKQTDPFYVLDLSNPQAPRVSGELKIPGYSSYLHPLENNRVLGIGKEDNKVKVTLFDVTDPQDPKELSTVFLSEYWSDVLNTHHAFTVKQEEQVFFLPGSQGGYIYSYTGDEIKLVHAVSGIQIKRAVYIGTTWFMIGQDGIVSYDENNWKKLGEVKFE